MSRHSHAWSWAALLAILWAAWTAPVLEAQKLRPLQADDLFRLEAITQAVLSPDGRTLAYVVQRPKHTAPTFGRPFLQNNDRADIWTMPARGGTPRNLTNGAGENVGSWGPVWSPDGRRLAFVSTRGTNVQLWVWDVTSDRVTQLTERAVDEPFRASAATWLSNEELVCVVLPEGRQPTRLTVERQSAETLMKAWPQAWAGEQPTASVLESGGPDTLEKRPKSELVVINAASGARRTIAAGNLRTIHVSPDRRHVAYVRQRRSPQPDPVRLLTHRQEGWLAVEVVPVALVQGRQAPLTLDADFIDSSSIRWSPDGTSVALIGQRVPDAPKRVLRLDLASRTTHTSANEDVAPTAVTWGGQGELLVLGVGNEPNADGESGRQNAPGDKRAWFRIGPEDRYLPLTNGMKSVPALLLRERNGTSFLGIADGDLWRIHVDGTPPRNLTDRFEPKLASVAWPTGPLADASPVHAIVAGVQRDRYLDYYQVDSAGGEPKPLPKPAAEASLLAFDEGVAVFSADARDATTLWVSDVAAGRHAVVLRTNTFLGEIAEGELKTISYRGLDGQDLKAWLIFPVGYEEGVKYPLITWVYAGSVARETPTLLASNNRDHALNLQLLAAHGYAVLLPSMPIAPEGEPSDPYMELSKGVLPAVDKVIDMGIADPKRLGLMGQSFGGYSTYGLITQTTRFQAAVSLAGLSDLVSLYGTLDPRTRYDEYANERIFNMSIMESGQIRMSNPPWKDLGRYLRNSPLFYVDRVNTPLMIVQGDMDYVAMQQGEQFFMALFRQKKRASFVRYWGEGHVLDSPANIRDMWQRVYAWFDEFLTPTPGASKPTTTQP